MICLFRRAFVGCLCTKEELRQKLLKASGVCTDGGELNTSFQSRFLVNNLDCDGFSRDILDSRCPIVFGRSNSSKAVLFDSLLFLYGLSWCCVTVIIPNAFGRQAMRTIGLGRWPSPAIALGLL